MVYTYTPTYYSSVHESITSICKTILPFPFKKRRLPAVAAAEKLLSKQQSENLKWQQDSFHQMLNLMGLCKEDMVPANEVSTFRTHLLETLIVSPIDHEPPLILRDKLIFLQELVHAKCISEEEYHASKRPLLQRLAVQGVEIDARDVIVGGTKKQTSNDEWSEIDLKDDKWSSNQQFTSTSNSKSNSKVKRMRGAASVFGIALKEKDTNSRSYRKPNHNGGSDGFRSILMEESLPSMMHEEQKSVGGAAEKEWGGGGSGLDKAEVKEKVRVGKRGWVFDGFKKWKRSDSKDETASFSSQKVDEKGYGGRLVSNPVGEGPDTRQIKRKLHPNGAPTDFFVDKVVAENIKKQLARIKTEKSLTDDEIEAISMRLPADKADLERLFPKCWCDEYGDIVLDVVRKEFKDHMRDMGNQRGGERQQQHI